MTEVILEANEVKGKEETLNREQEAKRIMMDLVHYRTYANTLADGRKETRNEVISRVKDMHVAKFP